MDKILEALSKLLPEDQVEDVTSAVNGMLDEAKAEIEAEFNTKLEEAYAELSDELKDAESTAETGYQEAWAIISDLRGRLDTQRGEFETALEEGYEEAYQMLLGERGKNEELEGSLYEEYESKLGSMREYFIDKIDEFLTHKGQELYEQARRDVLSDPRMVEHKCTLDRVVETVSEYISDEDFALATTSKIDEVNRANEHLQSKVRMLEAKNIRVSTENNKLNESLRQAGDLLREHEEVAASTEKNERIEKAGTVTGRGKQVTDDVEVIAEHQADTESDEGDGALVESLVDEGTLHQMQVLSGIKKDS
jgi:F0F1-type ATP synthase membrane subunit b/b'